MSSSVSFHETLHTTHTYGDVVDEEGFCHIECRHHLWWTLDEEREIGRAYEAVVYLMESGQHPEEAGMAESGRGLEKRTEEGAWKLYETQRDFRNVVLCEQDRLKERGETDISVITEQLADACKHLSEKSHACAREVALADAMKIRAYLQSTNRSSIRVAGVSGDARTSPLKSAAQRRVVPWARHVSMPLTDTIEKKALKASVEDAPVQKEAMTQAAKNALEGRQNANVATKPTVLKKKKKTPNTTESSSKDSTTKKVKKTKKKSKTSADQKDAAELEEQIRTLEKQVARKEAEKAKELAKKMSFGFNENKAKVEKKVQRKNSAKKITPATLQDVPPPRRASIKKVKASKSKLQATKAMGSSLSDLNASSDFSTVPPASESSASSFDGDQELFIREVKIETKTGRTRRQLSLFPKLRRKKGRKQEEVEEKASCHF